MRRFVLLSAALAAAFLALVGASAPGAAPAAGPTAIVESFGTPEPLDPALGYSSFAWQMGYATCLKLVNYPDRPAPEGSTLIPEAAIAMPWVSSDGLTYVFLVPPGRFRFSPPVAGVESPTPGGEPVTAESFRRALRRALAPAAQSPALTFVGMIEGVDAYHRGTAADISGVRVIGPTLIVHLTTRTPDLLARLAMPFFCAVPASAPAPSYWNMMPSAGPYYIAAADTGSVVLRANPNYTGRRPHVFSEIRYRFGVPLPDIEAHVTAGTADYDVSGVTAVGIDAIAARVGPGSPAALAGRQQLFVNPLLGIRYLALNSAPGRLFHAAPALRKAVNLAVDRAALTRITGSFSGIPTDQIIPPNMPGFRDVAIYPLAGTDIARAAALASAYVPASAELYTTTTATSANLANEVKRGLALVGISVNVHQFTFGELMQRLRTPGEPYDLALSGYIVDFADPSQLVGTLIRGGSELNYGHFDEPYWNARIDASQARYGAARYESFAALDRDLMRDAAPIVPIHAYASRDYFSARIGCHVYNPVYGMDIAALCLR